MYKSIITYFLILSIIITGCYSWELVQEPELDSTIKITTKNNEVYEMSIWQEEADNIVGDAGETKREGRFTKQLQTKINKGDIDKVEVRYVDGLKTLLFLAGTLIVIGVVVALTLEPIM